MWPPWSLGCQTLHKFLGEAQTSRQPGGLFAEFKSLKSPRIAKAIVLDWNAVHPYDACLPLFTAPTPHHLCTPNSLRIFACTHNTRLSINLYRGHKPKELNCFMIHRYQIPLVFFGDRNQLSNIILHYLVRRMICQNKKVHVKSRKS